MKAFTTKYMREAARKQLSREDTKITVTIMLTNGSQVERKYDSLEAALAMLEKDGVHKDDNVEGVYAEEPCSKRSWTLVADHCLEWEADWND